MQTRPSLKQFVVWATDSIHNIVRNPVLSSYIIIVGIQVILTASIIGVFAWGLTYVQDQTVATITQHVIEMTAHPTSVSPRLPDAIDSVRSQAFTTVFLIITFLSLVFGYIMTRFALRPTQRALSSQKRFIGDIAHELRTPLAVIRTSTEVALFDSNLSAETRELHEGTLVEIGRITEIIQNLLSLNTLARPRSFVKEPLSLTSLVETVVERHVPLARTRHIELQVNIQPTPMVDGNAVALEQVVTNLVKNALTYTPADSNGSVSISLTTKGDRVQLSVTDTGIGIIRKDLNHLFEPFYKGDVSRARGVGAGTSGLGLAIVSEILRAHHGSIRVKSIPDQGSTFTVLLSRSKQDHTDASVDNDQEINEVELNFGPSV